MLVKMFIAGFATIKADSTPLLDIFGDLDQGEIAEVAQYLGHKQFTSDIRKRDDGQVYILPDFPRLDMPFPQISVHVGEEGMDRYLGDTLGESVPVMDGENVVAWDMVKGYLAPGNWKVNVICATKDEAIWLTRCCQYFICQNLTAMEQQGLVEVLISVMDMQPAPGQQPIDVCCRAIQITGKVENTWKVRVPAFSFETGNNVALTKET